MSTKQKFSRDEALAVVRELLPALTAASERIVVAGSLRRGKAEVGDVEFVYISRMENRPVPGTLFDRRDYDLVTVAIEEMERAGVLGRRVNTKGSVMFGDKNKLMVHRASGMPVDFFRTTAECWWNYLVCRTGSAETNQRIAKAAHVMERSWNPYGPGFTDLQTGKVLAAGSEEEVFALCGLDYLEPSHR
jgi:DNA polymerase/3'-5' exonuclease PolX